MKVPIILSVLFLNCFHADAKSLLANYPDLSHQAIVLANEKSNLRSDQNQEKHHSDIFINKLRGGVQIRALRAVFSITNAFMFATGPNLEFGIGTGIEYYDKSGNTSSMIQIPLIMPVHVYISHARYIIIEPAYFVPLSVRHRNYLNESVSYPRNEYTSTFGGGIGFGSWISDQLAVELYIRANRFNLKGADPEIPFFIGVNLSYFLH